MIRPLLPVLVILGFACAGAPTTATIVHADSADFLLDVVTAVEEPSDRAPTATGFTAVRPNPFNPRTTIDIDVAPGTATIELAVYDVRGRRVRQLALGTLPAGRHQATWDGCDQAGRQAPSGTYVCRLVADGRTQSLKMQLAK